MNEEIKEMSYMLSYILSRTNDDVLVDDYIEKIEDYITNLQQRVEQLEKENKELKEKLK